jgi:hypothetical protein
MGGRSDISHLSVSDQKIKGSEGLFLGNVEIGSVEKIDIDIIGLQSLQTVLTALNDMVLRIPGVIRPGARFHKDLAGDEDFLSFSIPAKGLSKDLFTLPTRIDIGAIEEIDPGFKGSFNDLKGFLPIGWTSEIHRS